MATTSTPAVRLNTELPGRGHEQAWSKLRSLASARPKEALLAVRETLGEGDEQTARVVQSLRGPTYAEPDRANLRLVEVREHEFRYRIGGGGGLLA